MDDTRIAHDLPEVEYHAHPALSHSRAKLLVPPSTPAHFRYAEDAPREDKAVFDFGRAAHSLVLGAGSPIARLEFPDRRTSAYRDAEAAARAAGHTPLLAKDHDTVLAMAAALRSHLGAQGLLAGAHEVSAFRTDPVTGVELRARFDVLGGDVVADYKTALTAEPDGWSRAMFRYGYHTQAAWYLDMAEACGLAPERFAFIAQEKTPPYLVGLYQLPDSAIELGRETNRAAIDLYAQCVRAGEWPGYPTEVQVVDLPAYAYPGIDIEMEV